MNVPVEVIGLEKAYGHVSVLKDIDLSVNHGEFVSLLGPSGCGKSTLLRLLAGLETPDAGQILMGGQRVESLAPKQRNVAMVFQNYALYPHMTVMDNISLPLLTQRMSSFQRFPGISYLWPSLRQVRDGVVAQVKEVMDALQLTHLSSRKPGQLSGGQRQRVALARAMVRHPSIFLMDEPLSNLDAKLRLEVRDELADLHRRLGTPFLYVTHDQTEALTLSDRVAVMSEGRIIQFDKPERLYTHPAKLMVAQFIGTPAINTWEDQQRPGHTLAIRPEHVHLDPHFTPEPMVVEPARVTRIENHGAEVVVQAQTASGKRLLSKLFYRALPESVTVGEQVNLGWYTQDLLVFNANGDRLQDA